jgi:hypothetical protein
MSQLSPRRRRILRDVARAGAVVSAAMLILGLTSAGRQSASAAASGTLVVKTGPSFPVAGVLVDAGGSADQFVLEPPSGAACTGDSATGGYRLNSYWVPATVDPSTLTWDSVGPVPFGTGASLRLALYGKNNPFVNVNTAISTGAVTNLFPFDFAITGLTAADVPAGAYNVGIACTTSAGAVDKYWNVVFTFAAAPADKPTGVTWTVNQAAGGGATTTTAGQTTTTTAGATTTTAKSGVTTTTVRSGTTTTVAATSTTTAAAVTTTTSRLGSGSGTVSSGGGSSSSGSSLVVTGNSPFVLLMWGLLFLVFGRMAILLGRPSR